jgi:hypothetical protein
MEAMEILEKKFKTNIKSKNGQNYKNESQFYLEENGWDYRLALKEYKEDLNTEI